MRVVRRASMLGLCLALCLAWTAAQPVFTSVPLGGKDFLKPNRAVILIPGIGGSMLHAVNKETGEDELVWLRATYADAMFRKYLTPKYNESTHCAQSFEPGVEIVPPPTNHGLYAIDVLGPHMLLDSNYFHDMINSLINIGYAPGTTLFGFPYDWRQSVSLKRHSEQLKELIHEAHRASGGRSVDIVSHSMGGLLTRHFIRTHHDFATTFVHKWVTVATPWKGAAGLAVYSMLGGYALGHFLLEKNTVRDVGVGSPAFYELLPDPTYAWTTPFSITCKLGERFRTHDVSRLPAVMSDILRLETYESPNGQSHKRNFNNVIWNRTRSSLKRDEHELSLEGAHMREIKFYNIYGSGVDTPFSLTYETAIKSLPEILTQEPVFAQVDGDGTVPTESSHADGMKATARVALPNVGHVALLSHDGVFSHVRSFLDIGCPLDGTWTTSEGVMQIQHTGNRILVPKMASRKDINGSFILEGKVDGQSVKGVYHGPVAIVDFDLTVAHDCMSFVGTWSFRFPTRAGPTSFSGTRNLGSACMPSSSIPCSVPNGQGRRHCVFGVWSSDCVVESCEENYGYVGDDAFRSTECELCHLGHNPQEITDPQGLLRCRHLNVDVSDLLGCSHPFCHIFEFTVGSFSVTTLILVLATITVFRFLRATRDRGKALYVRCAGLPLFIRTKKI